MTIEPVFRLFFIVCATWLLLDFMQMDRAQLLSFNSIMRIGLMMLCIELALKLTLAPKGFAFSPHQQPIHNIDQQLLAQNSSSNSQTKDYVWSKIGLATLASGFLCESLMI
ncbi:hypothetical protein [Acinetobacter lanii]|uniref:Uncharacterized protein n=1 Tax=Acinetobacter lanii TaxID=2715163 RepID=A0A6G8S1B7_9GAMM|nr:hypothetical protein [Acinetobacter lanii]QIO07783.1 hypothetical protein G8D99_01215 [Acinetobacter lanii]